LEQLALLAADLHLLELGEVAQLQLEHGLGLRVGQPEALHELRLGMLLAADDADHLVDVEVGDQVAVEDVQPGEDLVVAALEAPAGGLEWALAACAEEL